MSEEKEKKTEEKKVLYKHYLQCSKCAFKFEIEHESSNNTKIGLDKMKCPICSNEVGLDPLKFYDQGKKSMASQARMNIEATKFALELAANQKKIDGEQKMVPVTSTQPGKSRGKTLMIPEKTIKSIEEKIEPVLEQL